METEVFGNYSEIFYDWHRKSGSWNNLSKFEYALLREYIQ